MHNSSMLRMKWFYENYCCKNNGVKTVLDIGSFCFEEHQSYREIFSSKSSDNYPSGLTGWGGDSFNYIGLDMLKGPNVNIVVKSPYKWNEIDDNFCDIVISGQAFEHIEFPWITMTEIARIVKPNGLICIIAPNGLGLHRTPVDCWRYYSDGMIALAKWAGLEILHASTNLAPKNAKKEWYGNWQDCMLVAKKPEIGIAKIDIDKYRCEPADLDKLRTGFATYEENSYNEIELIKPSIFKILKKLIKAFTPYGILILYWKIKEKNTR